MLVPTVLLIAGAVVVLLGIAWFLTTFNGTARDADAGPTELDDSKTYDPDHE